MGEGERERDGETERERAPVGGLHTNTHSPDDPVLIFRVHIVA